MNHYRFSIQGAHPCSIYAPDEPQVPETAFDDDFEYTHTHIST